MKQEKFDVVEVKGVKALLSILRIKEEEREQLRTKGLYVYGVRHDERWGEPCEIQKFILVNHYGDIITKEPIVLDEYGLINEEDWNFVGNYITLEEFVKQEEK